MLKSKNSVTAVIDSGIGGISILRQLIQKSGAGNYIYLADNLFMPYGNKSKESITKRVKELISLLRTNYNVNKIIIGCNTASACLNNTNLENVVTMKFDKNRQYFATELTKKTLKGHKVISNKTLAKQIEDNIFNRPKLKKIVDSHVKRHKLNNLNSLVLACTHYELVKDIFSSCCPKTKIINNSQFIINSINEKPQNNELNVVVLLTKKDYALESKILQIINTS